MRLSKLGVRFLFMSHVRYRIPERAQCLFISLQVSSGYSELVCESILIIIVYVKMIFTFHILFMKTRFLTFLFSGERFYVSMLFTFCSAKQTGRFQALFWNQNLPYIFTYNYVKLSLSCKHINKFLLCCIRV